MNTVLTNGMVLCLAWWWGGGGSIQIGYLVPQRQTYENWIHKQSNAPDGVYTVLSAHSDLIAAILKLIVVSLSERDKTHVCLYIRNNVSVTCTSWSDKD